MNSRQWRAVARPDKLKEMMGSTGAQHRKSNGSGSMHICPSDTLGTA